MNDKSVEKNTLPAPRSFGGIFFYHAGLLATKIFARLVYEGRENVPSDKNYVLAPNHQSYVDGMLVFKGLPKGHFKNTCAMVGDDLRYAHGTFGRILPMVGRPIYVNRKGSPVKSLIEAKKALQGGLNVLIHPEGTRTHDGLVAKLHDGASYLSRRGKVPMIPVYISGAYDCFSRHDKAPKFRHPVTGKRNIIRIIYGKPLDPAAYVSNAEMTEALSRWYKEKEKVFFERNPQARASEQYAQSSDSKL